MSTCTVSACSSPVLARSWCRRHYSRWQRSGKLVGVGRGTREWQLMRRCAWCADDISHRRGDTKYCCATCQAGYWRDGNHARSNEIMRLHDLRNPAARKARSVRRSSRIGALDCGCVRTAVIAAMSEVCVYCDAAAGSIDHVDPIALGGRHCVTNLVAACMRCNRLKAAKPLEKWLPERAEAVRASLPQHCSQE